MQIFGSVWKSKVVPQDWCDALLVPVDFIVMDVGVVLVEHRIRPETVVTVLGCNVQQAA